MITVREDEDDVEHPPAMITVREDEDDVEHPPEL